MITVKITFFVILMSIIHVHTNNYTFHHIVFSISGSCTGRHEQVVARDSHANEMRSFAKLRKLLVF